MLKYLDILIDILLILIILFITFYYMLDILRKPKINLIYKFIVFIVILFILNLYFNLLKKKNYNFENIICGLYKKTNETNLIEPFDKYLSSYDNI
jgi:DNA integrity scanning protein DisA with diadenylate cyclase activity